MWRRPAHRVRWSLSRNDCAARLAMLRAPECVGMRGGDIRQFPGTAGSRWRPAGLAGLPGLGSTASSRHASQPPGSFDPLTHPVVITEHRVIADQIRRPGRVPGGVRGSSCLWRGRQPGPCTRRWLGERPLAPGDLPSLSAAPPPGVSRTAPRHAPPRVSRPAAWLTPPRSSRPPIAESAPPPSPAARAVGHRARDQRQQSHTPGRCPPDPPVRTRAHDRPSSAKTPASAHWDLGAIPPRTPSNCQCWLGLTWTSVRTVPSPGSSPGW